MMANILIAVFGLASMACFFGEEYGWGTGFLALMILAGLYAVG